MGNSKTTSAFSLIELLAAIAIIGLLSLLSGPALRSLLGAGSVSKAVSDLSRTFEFSRAYAMSHNTYVRVAFAQLPSKAGGTSTAVLTIYSSDGSLDADAASDMGDPAKWPALLPQIILSNFEIDDALNASSPATNDDLLPSGSDISDFTRSVGNSHASGEESQFTSCVQFSPSGEGRVLKGEIANYIKLGCIHKSVDPRNQNPFVLRLSGINGSIQVIRKEQL